MPWGVRKQKNGKWAIVKKEGGKWKKVGESDSEEKAKASVRARYASESK